MRVGFSSEVRNIELPGMFIVDRLRVCLTSSSIAVACQFGTKCHDHTQLTPIANLVEPRTWIGVGVTVWGGFDFACECVEIVESRRFYYMVSIGAIATPAQTFVTMLAEPKVNGFGRRLA